MKEHLIVKFFSTIFPERKIALKVVTR